MTTPEIPDDVMQAARKILDAKGYAGWHFLDLTYDETAKFIARAILAERERCAKLVEAVKHMDEYTRADLIAAIERGDQP